MKVFVTWNQVEEFVTRVADRYKDTKLSGVYGLPRGGLVFAVMLSHRLNIPLLAAPCPECIIVDDICDSGESLLHYCKNSSAEQGKSVRYYIVTMYFKDNDLQVEPDLYVAKKKDDWIVFPWESKED